MAPFGIKIILDYRQKKSGKMLDIIGVFREEKNIPDFVVLLKITLLWWSTQSALFISFLKSPYIDGKKCKYFKLSLFSSQSHTITMIKKQKIFFFFTKSQYYADQENLYIQLF